jgi:aminotransferase
VRAVRGVSARVSALVLPPFDVINHRADALRAEGRHVISLGQAVPGFGPPPSALDAARRALLEPSTHRYSADAGRLGLRQALSAAFARAHGIDAQPDEIIVTAGGNQAFMLAAMTLFDPGDEVVLVSPYFVNHEMAIRAVGATPVEAPLAEENGFSARWEDIASRLTTRTRAVVLCTPSNPTGAVVAADELARIVRELSARNVLLVSDETYLHFVYGDAPHASAAAVEGWRDNVIVVGTFSKSFGMTGWRAGYLVAAGGICTEAMKIQDAMIICAPVISQIAAEAAVREDWDYARTFHDDLRARRAALESALGAGPPLRWCAAGGGFFLFVHVQGCQDSSALAAEILDRVHVITIPGVTFGASGEGFLRLSYGASSVEELTDAGERLRSFFTGSRRREGRSDLP